MRVFSVLAILAHIGAAHADDQSEAAYVPVQHEDHEAEHASLMSDCYSGPNARTAEPAKIENFTSWRDFLVARRLTVFGAK